MHSVFIAGSRALSKLNKAVQTRLDNIVKQNLTVLVGDANGMDKAVQRYLAEREYRNVFVYCMEECRNNVGDWPTRVHTADGPHDRHYYGIKDLAMAKAATWGFMIWDNASKGTLANVLNLVSGRKKVLLYSSPRSRFFTLRTGSDVVDALREVGIKDAPSLLQMLEEGSGHAASSLRST